MIRFLVVAVFLVGGLAHACQGPGEACKPGVDCCAGLVCTIRPGQSSICTGTPSPTTTSTVVVGQTTTTRPATTTTTLAPPPAPERFSAIRPTAQDLSLEAKPGEFYKWYRGRTATQPVRDAMQQTVLLFIGRAIRYARSTPRCAGAHDYAVNQLGSITAKLGNLYENLSSPWSVPPQGRNYSFDYNILERIQQCSIGADCTQPAPLTMELRDLFFLKAGADGRCERKTKLYRAARDFPELEVFSSQRAGLAPVNARRGFKPMGSLLELLHAVTSSHASASGVTTNFAPVGGSVDLRRRAYEEAAYNSGTTEEDKLSRAHFAALKAFDGYCDSRANGNPNGWTDDECVRWKHVEHVFMEAWDAAEVAGDWQVARNADSDHDLAHLCAALKEDALAVRFSFACPDDPHDCDITTCAEALDRMMPKAAMVTKPGEVVQGGTP